MTERAFEIREDDPRGEAPAALLREHLAGVAVHSPPESIHALGIEALCAADITFWTAWDDEQLVGCGALRELDAAHGEVKSMRTAEAHLRRGVAAQLLEHLLAEARHRGYARLSLETGVQDGFAPARALYERFGFTRCGPFASYGPDPNSFFMTLEL